MIYTIENEFLKVGISDLGAELMSVIGAGCEYIWQGNEEFWDSRAPIPFPFCGRLRNQKYLYRGKTYAVGNHGFARISHFNVICHKESEICFELISNDETKKMYPFDFVFRVWYILDGNKLTNRFEIFNSSENEILPATVGAHPGFNVPLDGGDFEDYYLEFDNECSPDRFLFSKRLLLTGKTKAYDLSGGKRIDLRHDLFDNDAIFLQRTDSAITLKSEKSDRFIKMMYSDMPYLGIWHWPKTKAPYVCIEPWCGMPAYDDKCDIESRAFMFRIQPGSTKTVEYSMIFG